jgi:hypothetical protein
MNKSNLAESQKIHKFAVRWCEVFQSQKAEEVDIEKEFAEDCFGIGLEMDCGESFKAAFPDSKAFNDTAELKKIIDCVNDIKILGAAIFSKYRYLTHWAMAGENDNLFSPDNREWFIIALSRLVYITK